MVGTVARTGRITRGQNCANDDRHTRRNEPHYAARRKDKLPSCCISSQPTAPTQMILKLTFRITCFRRRESAAANRLKKSWGSLPFGNSVIGMDLSRNLHNGCLCEVLASRSTINVAPLRVYTNQPSVTLYSNKRSCGTRARIMSLSSIILRFPFLRKSPSKKSSKTRKKACRVM